jgi:hypothetical protein
MATARRYCRPDAIVLCNGRPDAAMHWLPRIATPTLFIVTARDGSIRQLAEAASARLSGEKRIEVIAEAHAGAAASGPADAHHRAARWFSRHLVESGSAVDGA